MEFLRQKFYEKYNLTQTRSIRDFVNKIDWNNRLIGLKGSRGVGKTTLLLQYLKTNFKADNSVLYASLDNIYFTENHLYSTAEAFSKFGGQLLVLDEVHRYPDWSTEIKNIYDDFPSLMVIFTGSSLLHLQKAKADLSRRAVMYNLNGLSFREFLSFETKNEFSEISLNELLKNHVEISMDIVSKLKPLQYFKDYLNYGYYPFYLESKAAFHQKLGEIILTILEVDIPQFQNIQVANIVYLKRLLRIISNSVPFKPNINSLSERTGISINTLKHYLKYLADSQLLNLVFTEEKALNTLSKPEKIYLNNTNLMYNLTDLTTNTGNLRESFFVNQLSNYQLHTSYFADFMVDGTYHFEVGGKNKKMKQIKDRKDAYLVKDDIEIGSNNIIPLWLFGFLY